VEEEEDEEGRRKTKSVGGCLRIRKKANVVIQGGIGLEKKKKNITTNIADRGGVFAPGYSRAWFPR
jgi:hypothetical protein